MKALIFFVVVIFIDVNISAQVVFEKSKFKDGIYKTMDDLINLNADNSIKIESRIYNRENKTHKICRLKGNSVESKVKLYRRQKIEYVDDPGGRPIFYDATKNEVLPKCAAVFFRNELYINIFFYHKYLKGGDKINFMNESGKIFCKVTQFGKWLYFEDIVQNSFQKGAGYGMGGAIGIAIAESTPHLLKGVLFDPSQKKFNMIRNCKDFNKFLASQKVKSYNCTKKKIGVREVSGHIKKLIY